MTQYIHHDLWIKFTSLGGGRFNVDLFDESGGTADVRIQSMIHVGHVEQTLRKLGMILNITRSGRDPSGRAALSPEDLGDRLFRSIFRGPSLKMLQYNFDRVKKLNQEAREREIHHILRLRIRGSQTDKSTFNLLNLPWELMKPKGDFGWLLMHDYVTLTRSQTLPVGTHWIQSKRMLKILAVFPEPSNLPPFDQQKFIDGFSEEITSHDNLDMTIIKEKVTFDTLKETYRDGHFDFIHFAGHGGLHEGKHCLAFEKEDGSADYICAQKFAEAIRREDKVCHINLVACDSGKGPHQDVHYATFVTELMASGFPSITAMQFAISIEDGADYNKLLFHHIGMGRPLDVAVDEVRKVIFEKNNHTLDWAGYITCISGNQSPLLIVPDQVLVHVHQFEPKPQEKELEEDFDAVFTLKIPPLNFTDQQNSDIMAAVTSFKEEARLNSQKVLVFGGRAKLSVYGLLGRYFSANSGFEVAFRQGVPLRSHHNVWWTTGPRAPVSLITENTQPLVEKGDLAFAFSTKGSIFKEVKNALEKAGLAKTVHLFAKHTKENSENSVKNSDQARQIVDECVRDLNNLRVQTGAKTLHLFFNGPTPLIALLTTKLTLFEFIQFYEYDPQDRAWTYKPSFKVQKIEEPTVPVESVEWEYHKKETDPETGRPRFQKQNNSQKYKTKPKTIDKP